MGDGKAYVIITPVRDEQEFIGNTINSLLRQTILPAKWVIVNDGSTDRTREIVESYAKKHDFILLVNIERDGGRNFGRKALAFSRGLGELEDPIDYEFLGNLDADILLEPDYYENVLRGFNSDAKLGIGGGMICHKNGEVVSTRDRTVDSVGGAVQLFRRDCFQAVGGYPSLEYGGIDAAAEIKAKMLGWRVRKFPELMVIEQRQTGSAQARLLKSKFLEGRRFYSLGYGTLLYFVRCISRIGDPPFAIASAVAFCGFMESVLRRQPIQLPPEVTKYWRTEHWRRLKIMALRLFSRGH